MPPTLNPWLVRYISEHHQTTSRYEIDRYLIDGGFDPQDIEAVWQSLNSTSVESNKTPLNWQRILKFGKTIRRTFRIQLIGVVAILVLLLPIAIVIDSQLPFFSRSDTRIKYFKSSTAKLSPDGKLLAVAGDKIEIWDMSDQKVLRSFGNSSSGSFGWSKDSQYLALASTENTIQIWRVSDGVLMGSMANPPKEISFDYSSEIIFNSDKILLIWIYSYNRYNNIGHQTLWQVDQQAWTLLQTLPRSFNFTAFSQDKSLLAFPDANSDINVLRKGDDTIIKTLKLSEATKYGISAIAFSFNNEIIAVGFKTGTIQLWRINDNKLLNSFYSNNEGISELVFSPDGQYLAATNRHYDSEGTRLSDDTSIKLWRANDGTLIKKFEGHSNIISNLLFSADGQTLISTSWDNTLRFWPIE